MCFSAAASFTASGLLAAVGLLALKQIESKKELLLAGLPLVFALHQFDEGALWLLLTRDAYPSGRHLFAFIFLITAFCVWPIYSPLSIYALEPRGPRRSLMFCCIILGILVACYLGYSLMNSEIGAGILNCSINYEVAVPGPPELLLLYFIAVFGPYFLSSYPELPIMGAVNALAFVLTFYLYFETLISLWCFFGSLLSGMIFVFFRRHRTSEILTRDFNPQ